MRLSTIKLAGFKSFVDPTTLHLPTNMTGVVGPNGCGKSNIVDAIRWCMGEQSAKHLRGKAMEDVIFAGSETRGPAPMAEVSMTFDDVGFSHETLAVAMQGDDVEQAMATVDSIAGGDEDVARTTEEIDTGTPEGAAASLGVDAEGQPIPSAAEEVREMLAEQNTQELCEFCTALHPARTAEFMEGLEASDAWAVLRHAELALREEIFAYFPHEKQVEIIETQDRSEVAELLADLAADDRVDTEAEPRFTLGRDRQAAGAAVAAAPDRAGAAVHPLRPDLEGRRPGPVRRPACGWTPPTRPAPPATGC